MGLRIRENGKIEWEKQGGLDGWMTDRRPIQLRKEELRSESSGDRREEICCKRQKG